MNFKSLAKFTSLLALAGLAAISTPASAVAMLQPSLSVTFGDGCASSSEALVATNSSGNLGVTVTGPISLSTAAYCSASWTSRQSISVATDGYYFFGFNYDYIYQYSANSSGTAHFEFGGKLLEPPGLNLSTGFDFDVTGNHEFPTHETGGSIATDSFVYPYGTLLTAGTYTLEQTGLIWLQSYAEQSADLTFHIPVSTYLTEAPGPNQAPEPGSAALVGVALLTLVASRRRRKQ